MPDLFGNDDTPPIDGLKKPCPHCKHDGPHPIKICDSGPHYARALCWDCGSHVDWVRKPENQNGKRREASHRDLVRKFGRGYCEMCGIREADLPRGEALEGHHVDEYQAGGEPTRDNIWILCTACHTLVNWRRTYTAHLLALANKLTEWQK